MSLSRYVIARLTEAVGPQNVITDPLQLGAYEYDAALDRSRPEVVVFATTTAQVSDVLRLCHDKGLPVTPRGSGTSLSGGPVPLRGGVVLELARMNRVLEIDLDDQRAIVQPGYLNYDFIEELAKIGHLYAPDPSSQKVCTMGGNVAENSGGPHCFKYGVTTNHVTGLLVVLPDGEVMSLAGKAIEYPGYDLRGLVIGSEGTFAVVTEITCRIMPLPQSVVTMLAIFDSLVAAGEAVSSIIAAGMVPATLEMMDKPIIHAVEAALHAGYPLDAEAVLIIELDGLEAGMAEQVRAITALCTEKGALRFQTAQSERERELLWAGRKGAFGAVARIAPNKLVTDVAVPRTQLPRMLAETIKIGERHGLRIGNVFHAGDGNLHPQLLFDDRDEDQVRRVMAADKEIAKLAVSLGGVLTGEHGIGSQKAMSMPLMYAPQDIAAMRALKRVFDPAGTLNPGKVLPPPSPEEESAWSPSALNAMSVGRARSFAPESYEWAAVALAAATQERRKIAPVGGRTKVGDTGNALTLESRKLDAVVDLDWANLTVTVQAGARLADVQQALAEHHQFVPLSAPLADEATIGGIIAANSNGPLRYGVGDVRDVLLGIRFASARGAIINSGSKTVKNVAGYDLKRLFVGSGGSLGMILEATFRTLPLPPAEEALILRFPSSQAGADAAAAVRLSRLLPSAVELLNAAQWNAVAPVLNLPEEEPGAWRLLLSLRGAAAEVTYMREQLSDLAAGQGGEIAAVVEREAAGLLWQAIAAPSKFVAEPYFAFRAAVAPGRIGALVDGADDGGGGLLLRASAGSGVLHVVRVASDARAATAYADALASAARALGGWLAADAPAGRAREILPASRPDRVSSALKAEFDPAGVLPPAS
jgi:glycolate oxidase subunit GlcD